MGDAIYRAGRPGWILIWLAASLLSPSYSVGAEIKGPGPIGTPEGSGEWPAVAEAVASLRTHTIYRPAEMPDEGLPLVVWGNGACKDNGLMYASFLREIASHGFFIIAAGHPRAEGIERRDAADASASSQEREAPSRDETQAAQLIEAIDWAAKQNRREGGRFHRKIDTGRVAVMGHSCGGLQAIRVARDPRVATSMIFNSGVYNAGPAAGRSNIRVTKDELQGFHGPVAYINGGPGDIAFENSADDVSRIDHVPVFFAYDDTGHRGTFWAAPHGGDYAGIAVDWLSWQLKDDMKARETFVGTDCGLCRKSAWTVQKKKIE